MLAGGTKKGQDTDRDPDFREELLSEGVETFLFPGTRKPEKRLCATLINPTAGFRA